MLHENYTIETYVYYSIPLYHYYLIAHLFLLRDNPRSGPNPPYSPCLPRSPSLSSRPFGDKFLTQKGSHGLAAAHHAPRDRGATDYVKTQMMGVWKASNSVAAYARFRNIRPRTKAINRDVTSESQNYAPTAFTVPL